jgi:hypothetical protein
MLIVTFAVVLAVNQIAVFGANAGASGHCATAPSHPAAYPSW